MEGRGGRGSGALRFVRGEEGLDVPWGTWINVQGARDAILRCRALGGAPKLAAKGQFRGRFDPRSMGPCHRPPTQVQSQGMAPIKRAKWLAQRPARLRPQFHTRSLQPGLVNAAMALAGSSLSLERSGT